MGATGERALLFEDLERAFAVRDPRFAERLCAYAQQPDPPESAAEDHDPSEPLPRLDPETFTLARLRGALAKWNLAYRSEDERRALREEAWTKLEAAPHPPPRLRLHALIARLDELASEEGGGDPWAREQLVHVIQSEQRRDVKAADSCRAPQDQGPPVKVVAQARLRPLDHLLVEAPAVELRADCRRARLGESASGISRVELRLTLPVVGGSTDLDCGRLRLGVSRNPRHVRVDVEATRSETTSLERFLDPYRVDFRILSASVVVLDEGVGASAGQHQEGGAGEDDEMVS